MLVIRRHGLNFKAYLFTSTFSNEAHKTKLGPSNDAMASLMYVYIIFVMSSIGTANCIDSELAYRPAQESINICI